MFGGRPAKPSSPASLLTELSEKEPVQSQQVAEEGTTIGPQLLAATLSPKEHAERLQTLLGSVQDGNHQEIYIEVTGILLFYSLQEVNSLFSEYLALTERNLCDDVLSFFVKCQALNIAVPILTAVPKVEKRLSNGLVTFALSFIVAEALDLYLDNLNLPILVSLFGALIIAFFAEWILQPYVKDRIN